MLFPKTIYLSGELLGEEGVIKAISIFLADFGVEAYLSEFTDGEDERFDGLFLKKITGFWVDDGFQSTSLGVGDDRSTTGLSFKRNQTKVFYLGKNNCLSVAIILSESMIIDRANKSDVG